jgi:quinohemoprotein amine dehydrogenase
MKIVVTALCMLLTGSLAQAQKAAAPPSAEEKQKEKEKELDDGIPITNETVRKACGGCHKTDDKFRMTRISNRRTTPEGWQETIRRMATLNNVQLDPATAREVLKYLANNLGLAPEEAQPAAFEVEKQMIEYKYAADKDTEQICSKCHSMGRVISQRRTKGDWELLIAMHRGYYPLSDFQAFRRMGPLQTEPGPDGRPPDNRHPMEKALAHLTVAFPLKTPEWSAWSANMRAPKLAGRWALAAYQAGKGPAYGEVVITPGSADDEFITHATYHYARGGDTIERTGKAIVYTGFQWRGKSSAGASDKDGMREVMFVDRDVRELSGRWYNGAYDEIGLDVKLRRIGADAIALGVNPRALKAGTHGAEMAIHGVNLPADINAAAIDFGQGVKVTRVVNAAPDLVRVQVDVAKDAAVGVRDVFVAGSALAGGAVVYDKIDSVKVRPQAGMARIGGINFPKQYQQFEAVAYANGADGKPDTKDDVEIGPIEVAWGLEEFTATFGDDDIKYVGAIDDRGLFTPNVDGPNPARRNRANNYGDVWVVATYRPSTEDKNAKTIRARAHLLVTVPLYMRWDEAVAP